MVDYRYSNFISILTGSIFFSSPDHQPLSTPRFSYDQGKKGWGPLISPLSDSGLPPASFPSKDVRRRHDPNHTRTTPGRVPRGVMRCDERETEQSTWTGVMRDRGPGNGHISYCFGRNECLRSDAFRSFSDNDDESYAGPSTLGIFEGYSPDSLRAGSIYTSFSIGPRSNFDPLFL